MKKYYTLVQAFQPENRSLSEYLENQGIVYKLGADFSEELKEYGFNYTVSSGTLLKTFRVLIEEHELSAIILSVDGVSVIRNRPFLNILNKIRGYFSWILS
jgi:hypothetical protein